jgi:hypothetical protein
MPNLRLPVAPLTGGVSTQPDDSRLPNQVETSDNTILRLQRGLEKRPGSELVSQLNVTGTINNASFTHFFSFGSEDYVLIIDGAKSNPDIVQVFNLSDGTKANITVTAGEAYLTFGSPDARDKLKAVTYGTTTLLLNTEVSANVTGGANNNSADTVGTSLPLPPVNNSFATGYEPTNGDIKAASPYVVHLLNGQTGYPPGYYRVDTIANGNAVSGTAPYNTDDLDGPWYTRLEAQASDNTIDPASMPISLVRTATNTFTLNTITYNKRLSGDADTNPSPDFIGERILDMCIFQDRLWLGHQTGVTASQAGDLFNFWVDDYTNVTDADPISLVMPGPQAQQVQWLIPLDDRIVVFGTQSGQYEITTRDFFTPSSTNLQPTTRYASSGLVRPQLSGQQVVFLEDKIDTSALWEYFYDFGSDANISIDTSIQCQGYLPDNPRFLTTSPNNGLMFLAGSDARELTVYNFYWNVTEKVQSAFCKWKFYDYLDSNGDAIGTVALWGIHATQKYLYTVVRRLGEVWLERIPIAYPSNTSGLDFDITLDKKTTVNPVYDSGTNTTTWTITDWEDSDLEDADAYRIVLSSAWAPAGQEGTMLVPDSVTASGGSTVISVSGQWQSYEVDGDRQPTSTKSCIVGIKYTMSTQMSQPMARDNNGQTIQGNFQIRTLEVRHEDTVDFEVVVAPANRDSKTFPYYAGRVGSARVGELSRADYGRFNVRVFGNSQDTDITIQSDSPYPVLITKLEYLGDFVPQRTNPVKA